MKREIYITCFILVGGKSSRFGEDKSKLFYKIQFDKCKKIFKKVCFVAKNKKFKNYPFFIEKSKIYAPIFALEEIIKKEKKVFVLSVDTPLISEKSIKKLLFSHATASQNPLIGYYDYTMLPKIKESIKTDLRLFKINPKKIKINNKELININKKSDLKLIRKF
ncbi:MULTISPECIES: NTP transferase domain-containing protein [unclassified Lebetimonas]|uniref:NTP transferase domain-containing protein n=1 Tax=unclassified Lebetimonas TaxID=2648158 RepID=UPI0004665AF0|nr:MULTISPECIES: NTP transferase domain-containing protein [unclassified Lebetimonas]